MILSGEKENEMLDRIRLLCAFQVLEMAWTRGVNQPYGVGVERATEVVRELTGIYLGDHGMQRPVRGPALEDYFDSLGYDTPKRWRVEAPELEGAPA